MLKQNIKTGGVVENPDDLSKAGIIVDLTFYFKLNIYNMIPNKNMKSSRKTWKRT